MSCGGGWIDPFNFATPDPAAQRDQKAALQRAKDNAGRSVMTAQQQYLNMIQPYMQAGYQALPYMQSALYGGPQTNTVKTPVLDKGGKQVYVNGQPQFTEQTYSGNFDPASNSLVQNELKQNLGDLGRQQMATGQSAGSGSALSQQAKIRSNAYTNAYSRLADMVNGGRGTAGQAAQQVQGTGNTLANQQTNYGNSMASIYGDQAHQGQDTFQSLLGLGSLGIGAMGAFGGGLGSMGGAAKGAALAGTGSSGIGMGSGMPTSLGSYKLSVS